MHIIVNTTQKITGAVLTPSSKSHSVRGLLLAALAGGTTELINVLDSDDTAVARKVVEALGARLNVKKNIETGNGLDIQVKSNGAPITLSDKIFTGDSGITTRFALPLLGLRKNSNVPVQMDCSPQMRVRPIKPLIETLNRLGMKIQQLNNKQFYPLVVSGLLRGGRAEVDGMTSQYLSALMFALPLAVNNSEITVNKLNERPYAEMTARWLDEQAIEYKWENKNERDIIFIKGGQKYHPFKKIIPGDFSSASYLIAAGVLRGQEVRVRGLDFADPQGDKRLVEILKKMGADIQYKNNELVIYGGKKLSGMTIDCNDIPDMLPTLAIVATQASGRTELINVPQARLKETDRIHSLCDGLVRLGARAEELPNGLVVYESVLRGAAVRGYNDHRTVMALALAGLAAEGETKIDTAESINKTFPNFADLMRKLGAKIKMVN